MQKVILLPKMAIKNVFFCSRLVAFNETFAQLSKGKSICVLWHGAIAGRGAKQVASAFYHLITKFPEKSKFIFWADNCAGQNKNWTLFSMFCVVVNHVIPRSWPHIHEGR
jgi:hypothetical protein